jgi:N-glycosylase/DNA lyase
MQALSLSGLRFNPEVTFTSGQTFRWRKVTIREGVGWLGVVSRYVLLVNSAQIRCLGRWRGPSDSDRTGFEETFRSYLSFRDDLNKIHSSFPHDRFLSDSIRTYDGLRILTQNPWECLISFVCSINKNIPGIISMIELLSCRFGEKIITLDRPIFSFPEPSRLQRASKSDLLHCKVGFRWRFIQFISRQVASGKFDLYSLSSKRYNELRNALISELSGNTLGVGHKVADCVSLFAYHRTEAFPIDVWILRCLKKYYAEKLDMSSLLEHRNALSPKLYEALQQRALNYFGNYCGYAQQYLYMKIRNDTAVIRKTEKA